MIFDFLPEFILLPDCDDLRSHVVLLKNYESRIIFNHSHLIWSNGNKYIFTTNQC